MSLPAFLRPLGHGVHVVDTGFHRDDFDAAYLIVQDGQVVLWRHRGTQPLLDLRHPAVEQLLQRHMALPALLAACSVGVAMGLSPALLRASVETAGTVFSRT